MIKVKVIFNQRLIVDFMEKNNLSMSGFCKLCKISTLTYKKIFANVVDRIKIAAFFRIAKVLNASAADLILNVEFIEN